MKNILINLLCLLCGSLYSQSDTIRTFPIDYAKDAGMLAPTFEDSCLIDELAFDGPVLKAFMFKFSELNFIITLKLPEFDMVYIFRDGYLETLYEIGPTHFERLDTCDY